MNIFRQAAAANIFPPVRIEHVRECEDILTRIDYAIQRITNDMYDSHWLCRLLGDDFAKEFSEVEADIYELHRDNGEYAIVTGLKKMFDAWGIVGWIASKYSPLEVLEGYGNDVKSFIPLSTAWSDLRIGDCHQEYSNNQKHRIMNEYRLAWLNHMRNQLTA